MKKSIIALMGLFTLIACSEDSYQEADKMNETVNVDNGSGSQNSTLTVGPYYNSPFQYGTSENYGLTIKYINDTHFQLKLVPFVGAINSHSHAFFPTYPSIVPNFPKLDAVQIPGYTIPRYTTIVNTSCDMVLQHSTSNPCSTSPILYDFTGYPFSIAPLAEHSKIHYFEYYIVSEEAGIVASGIIKQKFMNDYDDDVTINSLDPSWVFYESFAPLYPTHGTIVMQHAETGELCLTNETGTVNPVLSEINFMDSGTNYKLEFYTTASDIVVHLN